MSFGFSAGDFIAALNLVGAVISALRSSGGSSSEYQALLSQLCTLETALLEVQRLELYEEQHIQVTALRQAAAQCHRAIDAFWQTIKKYQPSLTTGGSGDKLGNKIKDAWRKVEWAMCKKEDLAKFKADLVAHTESIELLLMTVQMGAAHITNQRNTASQRTLAGRIQDSYVACMGKLSIITGTITTGVEQGRRLLEISEGIIKTNIQIFQIVLNIQNFITRIPGQVERQQPVYLIDALGRHQPFHLEFILSAEAFTSVLRSNFQHVSNGSLKIERGDFAIQDSATKRDIDLSSRWESCFYPGQRVDMSMIFSLTKEFTAHCPKCDLKAVGSWTHDLECKRCGLIYQHSPSLSTQTPQTPKVVREHSSHSAGVPPGENDDKKRLAKLKRKRLQDEEENLALFRRVRIKISIAEPRMTKFHNSLVRVIPSIQHQYRDDISILTKRNVADDKMELWKHVRRGLGPNDISSFHLEKHKTVVIGHVRKIGEGGSLDVP